MEKRVKNLLCAAMVGVTAGFAAASQAAELMVTSVTDDGVGCTLREAIASVNTATNEPGCSAVGAYGTGDRIVFHPAFSGSTIFLNGSDIEIQRSVSLNVARSIDITVDAGGSSRIFLLATGGVDVGIRNMTLVNAYGSAIFARGDAPAIAPPIRLRIVDSTIKDGYTLGNGGGIYAEYTDLDLIGSTISGNTAGARGGGIHFGNFLSTQPGQHNGRLRMINSTISGNIAHNGGGVFFDLNTLAEIRQATIAYNHSETAGSGIFLGAGSDTSIVNSILSENTVPAPKNHSDCYGNLAVLSVMADSRSIISEDDCATGARDVDPNLLALANNGGPTQTHALFQDSCTGTFSPAINPHTVSTDMCIRDDQRGVRRDLLCDTGAYEAEIDACTSGGGHYEFGDDPRFVNIPLLTPCFPGPDDNPDCRVPMLVSEYLLQLADGAIGFPWQENLFLFAKADTRIVGYLAERLFRPHDFLPIINDDDDYNLVDPLFLWSQQAAQDGLVASCDDYHCWSRGYTKEEAILTLEGALDLAAQLEEGGMDAEERDALAAELTKHAEYYQLLTDTVGLENGQEWMGEGAISVGELLQLAAGYLGDVQ